MAVSFEVKTNNVKDLLDELKDKKAAALEAVGQAAETYAKLYCPVGTPESTHKPGYIGGTLRGSIGHEKDDDTAYIGTNIEYAPYVELGTYRMHPRHFLKKACENHLDEYMNVIKVHMEE